MANKVSNVQVFGLKSESTQNTAATLSDSDYAYAIDPSPEQDVEKIEQDYSRTTLDPLPDVTGKKSGKFEVSLPYRGTLVSNTPNNPLLAAFKMAGFAVSGGSAGADWTIAPIDAAPSNMYGAATSATATIIKDGLVHSYPGSLANLKMSFKTGARGIISLSGMGLDAAITDQSSWPSSPSVAPISVAPPILESAVIKIDNATGHVVCVFKLKTAYEIALITDGSAAAGVYGFQIVRKKPVITLTVLARTVAAYDYWNKMRASTQINSSSVGLQWILGTVAMNKFTHTVPTMQIKKMAYADVGGLLAVKLTCNPTFTSGADWMNIVQDNA